MKKTIHVLTCAMVGWVVSASSVTGAGAVTRRAPDSLQYSVRNNVAPTGSGSQTINGIYQIQYAEQGERVRQKLVLRVAGMESNATVSLTAAIGPDPANVVSVAHLPTDKRGRLNMNFMTQTPAPRRPSKIQPLPEPLSPLTEVGAICFEDSNGQVVGNAGVQDSQQFQLVVMRNLVPGDTSSTNGPAGSIRLVANQRRAILTLIAGGLNPNTDYTLALNGVTSAVVTSDARGMLRLRGWPTDAPPALQLRSLALHEAGGPLVLGTTLPR